MWRLASLAVLSLACFTSTIWAYSGGTGEPNDPYQIATAEDLIGLGNDPNNYDKHCVLTADIDLSGYVFDRAVVAKFSGTFDGQKHVIRHLRIQGQEYLGLFGTVSDNATIANLTIESVEIAGTDYVGAIAGICWGTIRSCQSSGQVSGDWYVGGLVGELYWGTVISCCAHGSASGDGYVGGLMGESDNGYIVASYSTALVSGSGAFSGGLVGVASSSCIVTSYASGAVNGYRYVGGLVGYSDSGSITTSYCLGAVSGEQYVGGLMGFVEGKTDSVGDGLSLVCLSFWNMETSGQEQSEGGVGLTTAQMQNPTTYVDAGWDCVDDMSDGLCDFWFIDQGNYPSLAVFSGSIPEEPNGAGTEDDPYCLADANDLAGAWYRPTSHYCLAADIDLSGVTWPMAVIPKLMGSFDGNGYEIHGLHIEGGGYLGLIGELFDQGSITDVNLTDVDVNGIWCVGGLVGDNNGGDVTSCHSSGTVCGVKDVGGLLGYSGARLSMSSTCGSVEGTSKVGGLVGAQGGDEIASCYSTATVSGDRYIGGLIGYMYYDADVMTSYSAGSVRGQNAVGGLVGGGDGSSIMSCYSSGWVEASGDSVGGLLGEPFTYTDSCFWDIETSGQAEDVLVTGLNTAEMQAFLPYFDEDWDFWGEMDNGTDDTWVQRLGDYPRLAWEFAEVNQVTEGLQFVSVTEEAFSGQMSRYETTNAQYCQYLNEALTEGVIEVVDQVVYAADDANHARPYIATHDVSSSSQIVYADGRFTVRIRDGFDMDNHPVIMVSWYGAQAFCDYYGYHLPSEEQWQAVADYDGTYTYGCGTSIESSQANYGEQGSRRSVRDVTKVQGVMVTSSVYPANPLRFGSAPYTSPVNAYASYGYGLNDMAGNVSEWTRSLYSDSSDERVCRGGRWSAGSSEAKVTSRVAISPETLSQDIGFRVCR